MLQKLLKLHQVKLDQNMAEIEKINSNISKLKYEKESLIEDNLINTKNSGTVLDFALMEQNRIYVKIESEKIEKEIDTLKEKLIDKNRERKDIYIEIEKYKELIKESDKIRKKEEEKSTQMQMEEFVQRR